MRAKEGFAVRKIADINILMPETEEMDFSNVLTMSNTALFIWECLQEECSYEDILSKLIAEFPDQGEDVLRNDLTEYLDALDGEGLLIR